MSDEESRLHTDLPEGETSTNRLPDNTERAQIRRFVEDYENLTLDNLAKDFPWMTTMDAFGKLFMRFTGESAKTLKSLEEMCPEETRTEVQKRSFIFANEIQIKIDNLLRDELKIEDGNTYSKEEIANFRNLNLYRNVYSATGSSFQNTSEFESDSPTRRSIEFTIDLYKILRSMDLTHDQICNSTI